MNLGDFMKNKKETIMIIIISIFAILLDQITKIMVLKTMNVADTVHVIKNFFRISYVQNTGAAWSIFTGSRLFLIATTILILGLFIYFVIKHEKITRKEQILYGVLIGGILGNLIDRIRLGYVVDFLDFNLGSFDFPVFNLADIFIVLSGIILILKLLKEDK